MTTVTPMIGDLLLVRGKGFVSEEIESVTKSPYSHVALFVSEDKLIEAQGLRRTGYQNPEVYRGQADVYRCLFLTPQERQNIVKNAEKHIGEHYDYPLILLEWLQHKFGIVIPWYEFHTRICSTLIAGAFREEHVPVCDGIVRPTPGEIAKDSNFTLEGAY